MAPAHGRQRPCRPPRWRGPRGRAGQRGGALRRGRPWDGGARPVSTGSLPGGDPACRPCPAAPKGAGGQPHLCKYADRCGVDTHTVRARSRFPAAQRRFTAQGTATGCSGGRPQGQGPSALGPQSPHTSVRRSHQRAAPLSRLGAVGPVRPGCQGTLRAPSGGGGRPRPPRASVPAVRRCLGLTYDTASGLLQYVDVRPAYMLLHRERCGFLSP